MSQLTLDDDFIVPDALVMCGADTVGVRRGGSDRKFTDSGRKGADPGKACVPGAVPPGVGRAAGDGRGDPI